MGDQPCVAGGHGLKTTIHLQFAHPPPPPPTGETGTLAEEIMESINLDGYSMLSLPGALTHSVAHYQPHVFPPGNYANKFPSCR